MKAADHHINIQVRLLHHFRNTVHVEFKEVETFHIKCVSRFVLNLKFTFTRI